MALLGSDVDRLAAAIEQRNAAHAMWGFKRPSILTRLGPAGLACFRHPRVVLCFRDPVGLAQRLAVAHNLPIEKALWYARRELDKNLRAVEHLSCPTLLVSFEKLKHDRDSFLQELFLFCGLDVAPDRYSAINREIDRAGVEYKRLASKPLVGYIDRPFGWGLSGWCCLPDASGPTAVDVLADGVKLTTALADSYRPDLLLAGFKSARHGFEIDLRQFALTGTEVINVMISGSNTALENSGYQLSNAL